MNSRSTEKKRKGSRIQSFKKREVKGGMLYKFDINKPTFQNYTDTTFSPSYACDFNMDKNNAVITAAETLKQSIMAKLVEFAFTNNSASFVHTIQCCFGLKGDTSNTWMQSARTITSLGTAGSGVSRNSNSIKNYFVDTGTKFLFENISDGNISDTIAAYTLLDIAATWGNDIIIEILLNIANKQKNFATDPIAKDVNKDTYMLNLTAVYSTPADGLASHEDIALTAVLGALYTKKVGNIQNNIPVKSITSNPIRCELLLLGMGGENVNNINIETAQANIVTELLKNSMFELLYHKQDTSSQVTAAGGEAAVDKVANLRYVPAVSKCNATTDYIDGEFCPYVSSGIIGTSSATGIISSEADNICKLLTDMKTIVNDENRQLFFEKFSFILFRYAFRDDQAAFNKILTCATNIFDANQKILFATLLSEQTEKSNNKYYTLLHISAIYGNIKIVRPLIQLYQEFMTNAYLKDYIRGVTPPLGIAPSLPSTASTPTSQVEYPSTPSVIECLYTRSDIKLDIFYGSLRKSTPSDSFAVQEYFKELINDEDEYTAQLKEIYNNNGNRILSIFTELNKLDASSWTSKKSILTPASNKNTSKIEYVHYIQSANVKLLENTTKFAIATGDIVSAIAANTTSAIAGVATGTTYLLYIAGKGLVTAMWNGTKWIKQDNVRDGAIDRNSKKLLTNTDNELEQMARVANDDERTKISHFLGSYFMEPVRTTLGDILVIKDSVKWIIIDNVAYDIRSGTNWNMIGR